MYQKTLRALFTVLCIALLLCACAPAADKVPDAEESPISDPDAAAVGAVAQQSPTPPTETPVYNTPPPALAPLTFPTSGFIAKEGVNLRSSPETTADILEVLGQNVELKLVSLQKEWYRVDYNGQTAYVHEDLIELGHAPRKHNMHWVKVLVPDAKLYKSPNSNDPSDLTLAEGTIVKALRTLNGYKHVVLDDYRQRYIAVTDIETTSAPEALEETPTPTATPTAAATATNTQ